MIYRPCTSMESVIRITGGRSAPGQTRLPGELVVTRSRGVVNTNRQDQTSSFPCVFGGFSLKHGEERRDETREDFAKLRGVTLLTVTDRFLKFRAGKSWSVRRKPSGTYQKAASIWRNVYRKRRHRDIESCIHGAA